MDEAEIILHNESFNADARLVPFRVESAKIPPVTIVKVDTIFIHDHRRGLHIHRTVYLFFNPQGVVYKYSVHFHDGYRRDFRGLHTERNQAGEVRLAPDCTVYLYPWLRRGSDSLMLAPVMLNGSQSDLMYRRRKALGRVDNRVEKLPPYVVLREGDHPLPRVNYTTATIPYPPWMDEAEIILHNESFSASAKP